MSLRRIAVAGLALSAVGFGAQVAHESYTSRAIQPVPGDRWTYGFGSTVKADGSPVKRGDTITPDAAVRLSITHISRDEQVLRACFDGAELHQHEWDALVRLAYNVGPTAVCRSSLPDKAKRGEYAAMCRTILDFKRVQGRDCSLPQNKSFCGGVWTSRQNEYRLCMEGRP